MKKNIHKRVVLGVLLSFGGLMVLPSTGQAAESQGGGEAVVINPGGGRLADGSDGIASVFNGAADLGNDTNTVSETGSDQIFYANTSQWCCGGGGLVLAIGGTAYGEAGAASDENLTSFDSIAVTAVSGSARKINNGVADNSIQALTNTGDGSATIKYEITHGGRLYRVTRVVSYQYPDKYYSESYSVTIPSGNTDPVKLYYGGDAAPGGEDSAYGKFYDINGRRFFLSLEPNSGIYLGFVETPGNEFDRYFVGVYDEPYPIIAAGQDLPNTVDETPDTDIGVQIQWNFGSTPGTYTRSMTGVSGFVADVDSDVNSLPATGMNLNLALAGLATGMLGAIVFVASRSTRRFA